MTTTTTNVVNNYNTSNQITGTTTTDGTPQPEQKTDCDKNPEASSCVKLGDETGTDKLSTKSSAVTVVAVAFASGACPAPLSFMVKGASYQFSYGPLCDRLALLKWLFLAMSSVIAAYILADSFKV